MSKNSLYYDRLDLFGKNGNYFMAYGNNFGICIEQFIILIEVRSMNICIRLDLKFISPNIE